MPDEKSVEIGKKSLPVYMIVNEKAIEQRS